MERFAPNVNPLVGKNIFKNKNRRLILYEVVILNNFTRKTGYGKSYRPELECINQDSPIMRMMDKHFLKIFPINRWHYVEIPI